MELMVKVSAFEFRLPGFVMLTNAGPAVATSEAGTSALNCPDE